VPGFHRLCCMLFGLLGLMPQEEIEISAHDQMRRQSNLMRLPAALGKEFVQHAESHLALRTRTLVDGGDYVAGTNMGNKVRKKVGDNKCQPIVHPGVACRL